MIDIMVILDRSGSMQDAKKDHEGGLQSFVHDQQGLAGDVRFTLCQFDSHNPCEIVYDRVPIGEVKDITLIPRGGTPLLDAMGLSIAHLEKRQGTDKPELTIVMVVTDGEENESKEWTKATVKARVEALEKTGWKFLFLGANIDAFAEASQMGVNLGGTMPFNNKSPVAVAAMYSATSSNTLRGRRASYSGASGQSVSNCMDYDDEQRIAASAGLPTITISGTPCTCKSTTGPAGCTAAVHEA